MRVLLDTHFLIWSMYDSSRLPEKLTEILKDENVWIEYSIVSLWESEIKHLKHPDSFEFTASDVLYDAQNAGYHMIGVEPLHIFTLGSLNDHSDSGHKDPFDKMLIAQAKSENMLFATHDKRPTVYNEPCVRYF